MILPANNDALYLTGPQARSRLGSIPSKSARGRLNGPAHVNCNILTFVTTSVAEAETGSCFLMGRDVIILRNTL